VVSCCVTFRKVDGLRKFLIAAYAIALLSACSHIHGAGTPLPQSLASSGETHTTALAGPPAVTSLPASAAPATYAATILADHPRAFYRLDDAGSTLADASGNGLSGAYGPGAAPAGSLLGGDTDSAHRFQGGTAYAQVAKDASLEPVSAVSVEAWVSWSGTPSGTFVSYGDSIHAPYDNYKLDYDPHFGGISFQICANGRYSKIGAVTANSGSTYHVVGTWDGTTQTLYVNGAAVASRPVAGTITNYTSTGLTLANDSSRAHGLSGTLDEAAIYATALSAQRVAAHYSAGASSVGSAPAPALATVSLPAVQPASKPAPPPTPAPTPAPAPRAALGQSNTGVPAHVKTAAFFHGNNEAVDVPASWMAAHTFMIESSVFGHTTGSVDPNVKQYHQLGGIATAYLDTVKEYYCNTATQSCGGQFGNVPESGWYHDGSGRRAYDATRPGSNTDMQLNPESPATQSAIATYTQSLVGQVDAVEFDDWHNCSGPKNAVGTYLDEFYDYNTPFPREFTTVGNCQNAMANLIQSSGLPAYFNDLGARQFENNIYRQYGPYLYLNLSKTFGALGESCVMGYGGSYAVRDQQTWITQLSDLLNTQAAGKYAICWATTGNAHNTRAANYLMASWWMIYDPNYSVIWPQLSSGRDAAGYPVEVYPEYDIVPTQPLQSANATGSSSDVQQLQAGGAYRREFGACYQAQAPIGNCAAVVNPTTSTVAIGGLTQSYSASLQVSGPSSWSGGTATWSNGVPSSLPPQSGVILRQ
jgi:hypothetical protein